MSKLFRGKISLAENLEGFCLVEKVNYEWSIKNLTCQKILSCLVTEKLGKFVVYTSHTYTMENSLGYCICFSGAPYL